MCRVGEKQGLLIAFAAGLVAGTAAALLLTPYSGREVREKIGDGVLDTKNYVKGYAAGARDAATAAANAARDAFRDSCGKIGTKA